MRPTTYLAIVIIGAGVLAALPAAAQQRIRSVASGTDIVIEALGGGGCSGDLVRGELADVSRLASTDAFAPTSACRVFGSSTTLDVGAAAALVVARRCGSIESSLGRSSFGWERPGPAAPCP